MKRRCCGYDFKSDATDTYPVKCNDYARPWSLFCHRHKRQRLTIRKIWLIPKVLSVPAIPMLCCPVMILPIMFAIHHIFNLTERTTVGIGVCSAVFFMIIGYIFFYNEQYNFWNT